MEIATLRRAGYRGTKLDLIQEIFEQPQDARARPPKLFAEAGAL
jgi:hypothetical protein